MNIICPKSLSAKKKKRVIRELVRGQEAATQLKVLLQKPFGTEGSLSAEEIAANVLRSFSETLSVLTSSSEPGGGEVDQNLLNSGNDLKPQDSTESKNRSKRATKDRRGCYKRRKTAQTWNIVSRTTDDNHSWRKYGQKDILNSKFPRSYFRCTRKSDHGCQATKQVQQTQESPDMYQTTYIGFHTCKDTPKAAHLVTDSGAWESFLENYHYNLERPIEKDHVISSLNPPIKQKYPKEDTSSDLTDQKLDPSLWSDLKDFEPSKPAIMPLSMASDNSDSQSLDVDFGVDSVNLCTDFHFDESQLL